MPPLQQHDYALYTDGSGCTSGWGASCAICEELLPEGDGHGWRDVVVGAYYGQTVNRCELTAFIDGVAAIVRRHIQALQDVAPPDTPKVGMKDLVGELRPTIMWFTDRKSISDCLLFDEHNVSYGSRTSDADLWLRWSLFARHVCISPRHDQRNVVPLQGVADSICSISRTALKSSQPGFRALLTIAGFHNNLLSCNQCRPQKSLF